MRHITHIGFIIFAFTFVSCRAPQNAATRQGGAAATTSIVNATAGGTVHRINVRQGSSVNQNDAVAEILVSSDEDTNAERPTLQSQTAQTTAPPAGNDLRAADRNIDAARAEVVRREVEVQRLTPLVAAGQASQGELDGARVEYDRAQANFQRAQDARGAARDNIVASRQAQIATPVAPITGRLITLRALSAGKVTEIHVREGDRINAGQPVATISADETQ